MSDAVVALFSGAGGFSLGFKRAGLAPCFAADIDAAACDSYTTNLDVSTSNLDLARADKQDLWFRLAPYQNCFAVIGGPPCQGFSTAGSRRPDDPRNMLVFRYLEIVEFVRPRWFIFENVEGILTSGGGESVRDILKCLTGLGYSVRLEKVNAAGYGLPQSRKRVLIVGNLLGIDFEFPPQTHSYVAGKHKSLSALPIGPSLWDAIGDLPGAGRRARPVRYEQDSHSDFSRRAREGNHAGTVLHHADTTRPGDVVKYALLSPGQTMKDLPEEHWHSSFRARAFRRVSDGMPTEKRGGAPAGMRRLIADQAAPTITGAANREFVHPVLDRSLTLRECARLQGFPDTYRFSGTPREVVQQIGNAVPPLMAEVFARHLKELDGTFGAGAIRASSGRRGLLGYRLTEANGMSPALRSTDAMLRALRVGHGESEQHAN